VKCVEHIIVINATTNYKIWVMMMKQHIVFVQNVLKNIFLIDNLFFI